MDLPKVVAALNLPASEDQLHAELGPARATASCTACPSSCPRPRSSGWWSASARCPRSWPRRPAELESVEGVGAATARHIRDGLARLVEASIFERYE